MTYYPVNNTLYFFGGRATPTTYSTYIYKWNLNNLSSLFEDIITRTPGRFISHGDSDDVLPIKVYEQACNFLKKNKLLYESYKLKNDTHTISPNAINLLQKFIKKNL